MIKERRHRKQIFELTTIAGAKLVEHDEIRKEIITFYQSLMGSAMINITVVSRTIMNTWPTFNHTQQLILRAEVTEKEIYDGFCSIGDDKAPGVDGYNVVFYKKAWPINKHDINEAVSKFFKTSKLYKAVNCTYLTLLPKVPNPSNIREYRPIACCTVLYKIIAKVLANRI